MNSNLSQETSQSLSLPLVFIEDKGQQKLAIQPPDSGGGGAVFIDFSSGKKAHRRIFGGGKNQPLAKAIGFTSKNIPSVLDATAGMGADSFVLACLGCKVTLIERSQQIAELLKDALNRASRDDNIKHIITNMTLINIDATTYLLQQKPNIDVVYLDPMYPEKKKKAAPKKAMKMLQTLVGADADSDKLLAAALKVAKKRVVVKRPKGAAYINDQKPHASISSPNTRYDIYSIKALNA